MFLRRKNGKKGSDRARIRENNLNTEEEGELAGVKKEGQRDAISLNYFSFSVGSVMIVINITPVK